MNFKPIENWIKEHPPQGECLLAGMAGVSPTAIRKLLHGKTQSPRVNFLQKIAAAIGCPVDELISDKPTKAESVRRRA